MSEQIRSFQELRVYQEAFAAQQEIFSATKRWPAEERYALTNQIRRSARSVGASLAEAWAKRRYPMNFVSKLSDADGELQETEHWLATAEACGHLSATEVKELQGRLNSIGKKLGAMMSKPETFIPRAVVVRPPSSDLRHPTSVLRPLSSGLGPPPA
jgi:four helix bundle protein